MVYRWQDDLINKWKNDKKHEADLREMQTNLKYSSQFSYRKLKTITRLIQYLNTDNFENIDDYFKDTYGVTKFYIYNKVAFLLNPEQQTKQLNQKQGA